MIRQGKEAGFSQSQICTSGRRRPVSTACLCLHRCSRTPKLAAAVNSEQHFSDLEWDVRSDSANEAVSSERITEEATDPGRDDGGSNSGIEAWQMQKLEMHAKSSRRKMEVKTLCQETGLPRQAVLGYLKSLRRGEHPNWIAEASLPEGGRHTVRGEDSPLVKDKFSHAKQMPSRTTRSLGGKRIGKATEATLESVFLEFNHPNDAVIDGIVTLHKLPRKEVVNWFIERRRKMVNGADHGQRHRRESTGRKGRY